ncbi:GspH/FimT family pseudopilin [Polaromonas jejuensis]|uniref:Type II secretion system protein H n=3 Tax=Polaromonas jejuensis TaxID=457502 RepID=A0ABW0QBC2_9BURK
MLVGGYNKCRTSVLGGAGRSRYLMGPLPEPELLQRGVTMIELVVVLVIVAILSVIAIPSFSTWIQNSQIRNSAEAIQNGLQMARTEAVRRNTQVSFWLTTTADATCALSAAGPNWVISFDNPAGLCANAFINEAFPVSDAVNNPAPRIIQMRSASEGSRNAVVAAGQSQITFNGMGRLSPVPGANININITNPTGGVCAAAGKMRCLRVVVSPNGQVRMCDPSLASTDPRGC